jgi:hypothetical protein
MVTLDIVNELVLVEGIDGIVGDDVSALATHKITHVFVVIGHPHWLALLHPVGHLLCLLVYPPPKLQQVQRLLKHLLL